MKYNLTNIQILKSLTGSTISLNDFIKAFYDCEIHSYPSDKYEILKSIVDYSIEIYRKKPYKGRVNEMGNYMEECLYQSVIGLGLGSSTRLGTGYPDNCSVIKDLEFPLYLDPKVSGDVVNHTNFRMFYTSVPSEETKKRKKITDGYHILINYEHDGKNNLTGRYRITDLDGFLYTMVNKQEASSRDIYDLHNKVIIESLQN